MSNDIAVALIIFNRPATTRLVFEQIARARPGKLFVIADGPRTEQEAELCRQTREIVTQIDWDCVVETNYSEKNLGCRARVSSGLDWVFSKSEAAIILEDDCLPDPSFFTYCESLLDKYWTDERIMTISGDNFQFGRRRTKYSYYFSNYSHIWGWATWRRTWQYYDVGMKDWPDHRSLDWLIEKTGSKEGAVYWQKILDRTYRAEINTWDYQLNYAIWRKNGLSVVPAHNLVANIGFGEGATHTDKKSRLANIPVRSMVFPLQHPEEFSPHKNADLYTTNNVFLKKRSLLSRATNIISRFFNIFGTI